MADRITLEVDQGCDWVSPIFVATEGDGNPDGLGGDGSRIPLAGYTALAVCRSGPDKSDPELFRLTDADGVLLSQITDPTNPACGNYQLTAPSATMKTLPKGKSWMDVDLILSSGPTTITRMGARLVLFCKTNTSQS